MPAEPVPPNAGMTPTGAMGGPPNSAAETGTLTFLATSPLHQLAQDYIDIFHIGSDYSILGNASAAAQDTTPFWNQLFTDFNKALLDFQVPGPSVTQSDYAAITSVPAGGGGTSISQISFGTALQTYANNQLGIRVFSQTPPVTVTA